MRSSLISLNKVLDELTDYSVIVHNHRHVSTDIETDGCYQAVSRFPSGIYEAEISVILPKDREKAGDMKNQFYGKWAAVDGQITDNGELLDDLISETGIEGGIFRCAKTPVTVKHHTVVDDVSYDASPDYDISWNKEVPPIGETSEGSLLVRTDYLDAKINFLMPEMLRFSEGQDCEANVPFLGYRPIQK